MRPTSNRINRGSGAMPAKERSLSVDGRSHTGQVAGTPMGGNQIGNHPSDNRRRHQEPMARNTSSPPRPNPQASVPAGTWQEDDSHFDHDQHHDYDHAHDDEHDDAAHDRARRLLTRSNAK